MRNSGLSAHCSQDADRPTKTWSDVGSTVLSLLFKGRVIQTAKRAPSSAAPPRRGFNPLSPSELFQAVHMSSTLMCRSARWKLLCLALESWYFRSSLRNWGEGIAVTSQSGAESVRRAFDSPRPSRPCPPSRRRRRPSLCGCCRWPRSSAGRSRPRRAADLSHTDLKRSECQGEARPRTATAR